MNLLLPTAFTISYVPGQKKQISAKTYFVCGLICAVIVIEEVFANFLTKIKEILTFISCKCYTVDMVYEYWNFIIATVSWVSILRNRLESIIVK